MTKAGRERSGFRFAGAECPGDGRERRGARDRKRVGLGECRDGDIDEGRVARIQRKYTRGRVCIMGSHGISWDLIPPTLIPNIPDEEREGWVAFSSVKGHGAVTPGQRDGPDIKSHSIAWMLSLSRAS